MCTQPSRAGLKSAAPTVLCGGSQPDARAQVQKRHVGHPARLHLRSPKIQRVPARGDSRPISSICTVGGTPDQMLERA
jgi:hypothetical protein